MIVSCIPPRIRRGAQSFFTSALHNAALAMLLALGASAANAQVEGEKVLPAKLVPLAKLSPAQLADIEEMLTEELQQRVGKAQKRIEGQQKNVTVNSVRFETRYYIENRPELFLVIDLSGVYMPRDAGMEALEDFNSELYNAVDELLRDPSDEDTPIRGVDFLYDGKDIFYYFPEEWTPPEPAPAGKMQTRQPGGTIVTSAGHGFYRHYGSACGPPWCPQRDPTNGITEDFITPGYATALSNWLIARSEATTHRTRSTATDTHVPSGQPWWKVAARYHLKQTYPQNPKIWHSLPNDNSNLREYKEDIRSRPLFANHIGAGTILHLHTNAASDPAVHGTRAYFYTGRTAHQQLADSILCYMKELIHAREPYQNYLVRNQSEAGNHGENRLATMPSVIVEVGYHTNPGDAAALQDPVFRTAAMKGVEKGYRLHAEGEPCQPFRIDSIPDVSGPQNTPIPVNVHYEGFPEFPVKVKVDVVSCPSGWTCTGGELTIEDETPSPLQYTWTCNVPEPQPAATFGLRTRLTDVDQVKAPPVEHNVTCTPAAGPASDGGTVGQPSARIGTG